MVRLKDVAEKAGVSIWTVSKVLGAESARGNARISPACARKVIKAADLLGYRANYHARSLQKGCSQCIGLLMGADTNVHVDPFWAHLLGGVEARARALGYDTIVIGPANNKSEVERGISYIKEQRVDSLIVAGHICADFREGKMESLDIPIVVAASSRQSRHWTVEVDPGPGIVAAVAHLAELGHRSLIWFCPEEGRTVQAEERRIAFECAAKAAGIKEQKTYFDKNQKIGSIAELIAAARNHILPMLKKTHTFTGVVCYNEATALGVYSAANELGIRIPRDLSVVGFDDLYSHVTLPAMTVASHMLPEMGACAAELAIRLGSAENGQAGQKAGEFASDKPLHPVTKIPSKLIVRSSTAAPSSGDSNKP